MSMVPDARSWGAYHSRLEIARGIVARELKRSRYLGDDPEFDLRVSDLMYLDAYDLSRRAANADVDASIISDAVESEIVARRGRNVT